MQSEKINLAIKVLSDCISDLKTIELLKNETNDIGLIAILEEERIELRDILCQAADNCLLILKAYIEECRKRNVPISLEYYRVMKAITDSQSH